MKAYQLLLRILGLICFTCSCMAGDTAESFTRTMLARFQTAAPSHNFDYVGPLQLKISTTGTIVYLDRIYSYTMENPSSAEDAQRSYVLRMVRAIAEADQPLSKNDLRLAVRNAGSLRNTLEAMGPGPKAAYPRDFVGDLVLVPVFDTLTTVKFANERNLTAIGLTEDEAVELGRKNLRRAQEPFTKVAKTPRKSAIGVISEEYAASRLIFTEDWKIIEKKIGGNLIVMAPSVDTVIFGDGSNVISVDALRAMGLKIAAESQVPLSPTVFRLAGDRWEEVK